MELHSRLEAVADVATFLDFARALLADRENTNEGDLDAGRGKAGWESDTIEGFLESAIAWAEDSEFGVTQGLAESSPWKRFAIFLYCGKIYE